MTLGRKVIVCLGEILTEHNTELFKNVNNGYSNLLMDNDKCIESS